MRTEIGKIKNITFGYGGYQEAMFGLSVTLGSDKGCWGVQDFKGAWNIGMEVTEHTEWTETERRDQFAETIIFANELMIKAKVKNINDLKGIPVEATFDGNLLKEWRILEEVI